MKGKTMKRTRAVGAAAIAAVVSAAVIVVGVNHAASGADKSPPSTYDHSTTKVTTEYPDGPPAGKNRVAPSALTVTDSHTLSYENSAADVVLLDPKTGAVLASKHVAFGKHTKHKTIKIGPMIRKLRHQLSVSDHGTGGTSTASGRVKVTIWQFGRTDIGKKLWTQRVWIDWSWNRAPQVVTVIDSGRDKDVNDSAWEWNGWTEGSQGYYDWAADDGHPHSAFQRMAESEFSGPNFVVHTAHDYPTTILHAYYNGTNEWWNTCCT